MKHELNEIVIKIKESINIVDFISDYTQLSYLNGLYHGKCPLHNDGVAFLIVNPVAQTYQCLFCGSGGDIFTFVKNKEKCSYEEAIIYLAKRLNIVSSDIESEDQNKMHRIYKIYKHAGIFYYCNRQNKDAHSYLLERGLTNSTVVKFGLGYAPTSYGTNLGLYNYLKTKSFTDDEISLSELFVYKSDKIYNRFWERIMFPIMDLDNRVVAFGGRNIKDEKPKYVNSTNTLIYDKSRMLYALNYAQFTKREYFLLCEGYMDVITLHQAGFDNAVATLGTALTVQQAKLIKSIKEEVIICYDNDKAGIDATVRTLKILREAGIRVKVLRLNKCKDPDEYLKKYGKAEFQKCISNAISGLEYELELLCMQEQNVVEERLMSILIEYKVMCDYNKLLCILQNKLGLPANQIVGIKTRLNL